MANRYWIGGSGNWGDASHWSTTSGGTWDASIPTIDDDVFFDASSHLGAEVVKNNTFDDTTSWIIQGTSVNIADGVAHYVGAHGTSGICQSCLIIGRTYAYTWEIKSYVSGNISMTDSMGTFGGYKNANGVYSGTVVPTGFQVWPMANVGTMDIDNIYFREVRSLNVNLDISANCRSMDWSDIDVSAQFTSSVNSAYIYGDLTLNSSLYWNFTGTAYTYMKGADASYYITQNNAVFYCNQFYLDSSKSTWINSDDFYASGMAYLNLSSGTWNTNSKTITSRYYIRLNQTTGVKTFIMNDSSIYTNYFSNQGSAAANINRGTSTIYWKSAFTGGGKRYYNAIFTGTASNTFINDVGTSFENLSFLPPSRSIFTFFTDISVANLITIYGYDSSSNRIMLNSNTLGSRRILYANDISCCNVDFQDISAGGTANWDLSSIPGGAGDCGGNYGIVFTPSVSCYYVHDSGTTYWSDASKWRTASGAIEYARVPLPQDNAIFDENSFVGDSILTLNVSRFRTLNMSAVDSSVTLTLANEIECYGNFILGSNILLSGSYAIYLEGRNNLIFNSYGQPIHQLYIDSFGGTYTSQSDIISLQEGSPNINVRYGTFNVNNYDICVGLYMTIASGATCYMGNGTYTSYRAGTGNIFYNLGKVYGEECTIIANSKYAINTNLTFSGGNETYKKIIFSGIHTGTYIISGNNTFNDLIINPGRKISFTGNTTQTINNSFIALGTSDSSITLSSTTSGTKFNLNATNTYVRIKEAYISDASVSPVEDWIAVNSYDLGGNTGITFSEGGYEYIDYYWVGNSGNWSDSSHWAPTSGGTPAAYTITSSDNVYFDANSFDTSSAIHIGSGFKDFNMSAITQPISLYLDNNIDCYGDFILGPSVNLMYASTQYLNFWGQNNIMNAYQTSFLNNRITFEPSAYYVLLSNIIQNNYILAGIYMDTATLDVSNHTITTYEITNEGTGGNIYLRNGILNLYYRAYLYRINLYTDPSSIIKLLNNVDNSNINIGNLSEISAKNLGTLWLAKGTNNNICTIGRTYGSNPKINTLKIDSGLNVKFEKNFQYDISTFIAYGTADSSIFISSDVPGNKFTLNYTGDTDVQANYLYVQDCSAIPNDIWSAGNHGVDLGNNTGWKFRHHRKIHPVMFGNKLIMPFLYDEVRGTL